MPHLLEYHHLMYPRESPLSPSVPDRPPPYSSFLVESNKIDQTQNPPSYTENLEKSFGKSNKRSKNRPVNQANQVTDSDEGTHNVFPILPQPFQSDIN